MTPEEKAKELIKKFTTVMDETLDVSYSYSYITGEEDCAKKSAILCCKEILEAGQWIWSDVEHNGEWETNHVKKYYTEVLAHLESL